MPVMISCVVVPPKCPMNRDSVMAAPPTRSQRRDTVGARWCNVGFTNRCFGLLVQRLTAKVLKCVISNIVPCHHHCSFSHSQVPCSHSQTFSQCRSEEHRPTSDAALHLSRQQPRGPHDHPLQQHRQAPAAGRRPLV